MMPRGCRSKTQELIRLLAQDAYKDIGKDPRLDKFVENEVWTHFSVEVPITIIIFIITIMLVG